MYHTESFLNKNTYFSKGHIWSFAMAQSGSLCFFWCVLESGDDGSSEIEAALANWFEQELPYFLEKGEAIIQKELNRFGEWLGRLDKAQKDVNMPILYLYFKGKIYAYGSDKAVFEQYKGHRGVILWPYNGEYVRGKKTIEEAANDLKTDMLKAMSRGELELGYFMMWEDEYDF